ncbi:VOC family protein [Cellulomonas fengjieae]|uniref:VOC family protein n=1 Tax=Cellulomonas fengjieae TaxID=2819978 RepID=A0ABS3SE92_9CELL|nr:VOC family protein [Cellulomonas fengjieae]MBO3084069.1 VOC family protein [Cellulomonas fengjieae]QVI64675.1 VOC family protein [Cellulomonas fengjieae]
MAPVVSQLTIDSADPHALARWWNEVLGWRHAWDPADDEEEVGIEPADGSATAWLFLKVADAKAGKNRLHVDLRPQNGSDQATELERLLALGATRVDIGQGDVPWHVLADPEGNEFCLLRSTPDEAAAADAADAEQATGA